MRHVIRTLALPLALAVTSATIAQDNDPGSATTPDPNDVLNDTRRALVVEATVGAGIATRADVYVSDTPPGAHVGAPAELRLEWYDAGGSRLGGRNAWNPRREFVRDGDNESAVMLAEATGAFTIPFTHEIASVSVTEVETDTTLLTTDVRNVVEGFCMASPGDPNCEGFGVSTDSDGDGVEDSVDNCPADPNPDQADNDADGVGDACDSDDDGDGVDDGADNCPLAANASQLDTDGDGTGDACDSDDDGDTVDDAVDNCPLTQNADQADLDMDGIGDACDGDTDGDGVDDSVDNCPLTANDGQADADGDGTGDACDNDPDPAPRADDGGGAPSPLLWLLLAAVVLRRRYATAE
ncbi:MAG: thrombospondin type 3 repeat-containing protein [Woeseiaceae bacterium]|nr:thrombospondin type 3 repeat-containing protein [Woeseiaceae bacterium]